MTNYDVVKKLIGPITPCGESNTDKDRLENLKALCELMDQIHTDIDYVSYKYKDSNYASEKAMGIYADKFLDKLFVKE